jgi:hypothetical protein
LYLRRVHASQNAALFTDPDSPDFPAEDLDLCTQLDRFDFSLPVRRVGGRLEMRRWA